MPHTVIKSIDVGNRIQLTFNLSKANLRLYHHKVRCVNHRCLVLFLETHEQVFIQPILGTSNRPKKQFHPIFMNGWIYQNNLIRTWMKVYFEVLLTARQLDHWNAHLSMVGSARNCIPGIPYSMFIHLPWSLFFSTIMLLLLLPYKGASSVLINSQTSWVLWPPFSLQ